VVVYDTSSKEDATPATKVSKRSLRVLAIRIEIYQSTYNSPARHPDEMLNYTSTNSSDKVALPLLPAHFLPSK